MPQAARPTDPTAHGDPLDPGPGSDNVTSAGKKQWRAGPDTHLCKHPVSDATEICKLGSLTVKVNGNNTGFTTEDNADNLDKPGGDCSGTPGNTADPACCKYSTEEKVTANIRVWIHC